MLPDSRRTYHPILCEEMATQEHFANVEEKLTRLLASLTSFSETERDEVQKFVDVGEYGLAAETAYQIILEERKPVTDQAVAMLRELAAAMGIADSVDVRRLNVGTE